MLMLPLTPTSAVLMLVLAPVPVASMQLPLPAVPALATARAETVVEFRKKGVKNRCSDLETITSTALALAVFGPLAGGLLTVTVTPFEPLVKPLCAATAWAADFAPCTESPA